MDYEKLAKSYRKKFITDFKEISALKVNFSKEDVKKILPHRDPFLFIDSITDIDLEQQIIGGTRKILENDPVFKGHFPMQPVYPGALLIETIGQIGICLLHFLNGNSYKIDENDKPINVRAVHVNHALMQHEVLPGDELTIISKNIVYDEYLAQGIGQIIKNGKICVVAIGEFYII